MSVRTIKIFLTIMAAVGCAASCIYVDETLGSNMVPANQRYEVHMAEFKLNDVKMGFTDSLTAYSDSRITIGALRDERFGLTTRGSAVTLVPILDTINLGIDPIVKYFHFTAARDTTSVANFNQQNIIQNVNVYALTQRLDSTYIYACDDRYDTFYDSSKRISKGVPVYAGGDSLSFDFTEEFAQKVMDVFLEDPAAAIDLEGYLKKFPGIYMTMDEPIGYGGRINMFDVTVQGDDAGYVVSGYADLEVKAKYKENEDYRDTLFVFFFSPAEKSTSSDQYAFNVCSHESKESTFTTDERGYVDCTDKIYVEGGAGLKPVFSAVEMKQLMLEELEANGLTPEDVVINKATIIMPYEVPDDYDYFYLMPSILSPTCKFSYDANLIKEDGTAMNYVYYAGLTDSSVEDEDKGDINRSLDLYSPDITHHMQELLRIADDTLATGRYDVWMLVLSEEEVTIDTSNQDLSEYYEYLAYSAYYDSMYNGYGAYTTDSYSNYYYYMYLADAYANSSSTTYQNVLDKDKYYTGVLKGPTSDDGPRLKVIYSSVVRDEE